MKPTEESDELDGDCRDYIDRIRSVRDIWRCVYYKKSLSRRGGKDEPEGDDATRRGLCRCGSGTDYNDSALGGDRE